MNSEALRAWARQTAHELIHGEEVEVHEAEEDVESAGRRVLRARVALAIVALSIFSAVAGWRASVFDERSSSSNAVFHQDLVIQQQLETKHEAAVARDITQYGDFEQHWFLLAHPEAAGSTSASPNNAQAVEAERVAAEASLAGFQTFKFLHFPALGATSYDPAAAYNNNVAGDTQLEALHPADALSESNSEANQAVDMTGVAALFVAALVLFTLAQVILGHRAQARPGGVVGRWTRSHTLMLAGTLVTAVAAVLFVLVMVE